MRRLLFAAALVLILSLHSFAFAESIEVKSKVTKVTVYTNAAQITRQAQVNIKAGFNEVVFTNVPENLNEGTLTVSAKGEAQAKILDAKIKKIFLERPESEQVRKLEDEIRELEDKIVEFNNRQTVIGEEREFLKSIKLYAAQQIPEDLVTKMPKSEELDSLNSFLKEKWQDTFVRELEIEKQSRNTKKRLARLKKDLSQLHQAQRREKRVISIELDVQKPGSLTISASYLMYQASWYPEYDARVNYEKQKVELICLGVVKQVSGEDWQGVELTLSTAKPTVSGRMPELQSWILRPYQPQPVRKKRVQIFAPSMEKMRVGAGDIAEGILEEKEAAMLYAQAEEKLTSVNYKITRSVDIKSDGSKHRLPVFTQDFSVKFQYSTTPKLSPFAYLVARVTNEREQLLPASLRIFLDDIYVGTSSINAVGTGEELDLYLGIDEGVKVKREKLKEKKKEIWIAGIKRKNQVIIVTYKITVENYKNKDIKLDLFDHIPVSQSDQIAVKVLEMQPKPNEEDYEDRKGVMQWKLNIASRHKEEVIITYQIEHPRNMNISF
jgi:uncharacterized protein (TIGR02231 family)